MREIDLRKDADQIIRHAIEDSLPDTAVMKALSAFHTEKNVYVIAVGKAAWRMAASASNCLGTAIQEGIVITKYEHSEGTIPNFHIYEAGHPVPDQNTYAATQSAIQLAEKLTEHDVLLFFLSGGGSALFESPLVSHQDMELVTSQLLACGADIIEINTIRKRLSAVKGGRFAALCVPAAVYSIVLSDVLSDQPDMIASGPTCLDVSTCQDALRVVEKYRLDFPENVMQLLAATKRRQG